MSATQHQETHPAVKMMAYQNLSLAQQSMQTGVREFSPWRNAATVVMAGALTATNPALSYTAHIATNPTNPMISLSAGDTSAWFSEDERELAHFIALLDNDIDQHPETVVAADAGQLDRIAQLIAGVSV